MNCLVKGSKKAGGVIIMKKSIVSDKMEGYRSGGIAHRARFLKSSIFALSLVFMAVFGGHKFKETRFGDLSQFFSRLVPLLFILVLLISPPLHIEKIIDKF